MNPLELFRQGQLSAAVQAAIDQVKNAPADRAKRFVLAELLAFTGDYDRADKHLDAASNINAPDMLALLQFRQVLRAEGARQQVFAEGRSPQFLSTPTEDSKARLEALLALRQNDAAGALAKLEAAETARPKVSGTCDGVPFEDARDLDDVLGPTLEVCTAKGTYFWVPFSQVVSLEFTPPERPRDVQWRKAKLVVKDGPDGEVFIPTLYIGTHLESDDALRLGKATEWRGEGQTPIRGIGHRQLMFDESVKPLLNIQSITFG
jgi:type VI secretion system protein ImpE